MNRRNFMELLAMSGAAFTTGAFYSFSTKEGRATRKDIPINATELSADVVIAGAGVGGFAAAMAALRNGRSVILTEQTDWMGGQLTQQGLSCLDEHRWIESFGATKFYRDFRTAV